MKYQVKLICSWMDNEGLLNLWKRQSKQISGGWDNFSFSTNKPLQEYDFFVIINQPNTNEFVPNRSLVFQMEPRAERYHQWNNWYKSKDEFLLWLDLDRFVNNHEWHIDKTYDNLKEFSPPKSKLLSSVISSQYIMENHKRRVDFVKELSGYIAIDVFGRSNEKEFTNFQGSLPQCDKLNGLAPYKYSFAGENTTRINNYTTEKLIDCILCETLAFYSGPNKISEIIDNQAFIAIDLIGTTNMTNIQFIKTCIENDEFSKRLPSIRKAKNKILEVTQIFPRIDRLLTMITTNYRLTDIATLKIPIQNFIKNNFYVTQIDHIQPVFSSDFCEKFASVLDKCKILQTFDICLTSSLEIDKHPIMSQYKLINIQPNYITVDTGFDLLISRVPLFEKFEMPNTDGTSQQDSFLAWSEYKLKIFENIHSKFNLKESVLLI